MEMKEKTLLHTSQLLEGLPTRIPLLLPPPASSPPLWLPLLKAEAAFNLPSSPGPALEASPASQRAGPNRVGLCFTC